MATVVQRNGIRSRIVVRDVQKRHFAPGVSVVVAPGGGYLRIPRAAEHLQPSVLMFQDTRLYCVDRFCTLSLNGLSAFLVVCIDSSLFTVLGGNG